jgi:hypothetical protein
LTKLLFPTPDEPSNYIEKSFEINIFSLTSNLIYENLKLTQYDVTNHIIAIVHSNEKHCEGMVNEIGSNYESKTKRYWIKRIPSTSPNQ